MYGLEVDKEKPRDLLTAQSPHRQLVQFLHALVVSLPSDVLVRKSLQMCEMGSVFASITKGDKREPHRPGASNARHVLSDSPKA